MLEALTEARNRAQTELASAEIVLLEASAAAGTLREEVDRLKAAVAALSGEAPAEPPVLLYDLTAPEKGLMSSEEFDRRSTAELSPEEFDKQRIARQKAAKKARLAEEEANNPLFHLKCSGCGRSGKIFETMMQAPSGATIRMMVCAGCNNQMMG